MKSRNLFFKLFTPLWIQRGEEPPVHGEDVGGVLLWRPREGLHEAEVEGGSGVVGGAGQRAEVGLHGAGVVHVVVQPKRINYRGLLYSAET